MQGPAGAMDALTGAVLDRKYRLERPLGRGGMGAVFLATHLGTERPVALKVIAPEHATRPEFVERFRREARSLGRLRHPSVVDVTDFGVADHAGTPVPYLVMELLVGASMASIAANGALCEPLIAQLLVAPLRPPRLELLFQGVRSRAGAHARTLAGWLGGVAVIIAPVLVAGPRGPLPRVVVLGVTVLYLVWVIAAYDRYMFTAQVVVMEGLEGGAARERSRLLAREAHSRLKHLETAATVPVVVTAVLVALAGVSVLARVRGALGPLLALGLFGLAFTLASILFAPALSASLALLYVRVRESLGEPLGTILERYERVALPEIAWPRRLRDRLVFDITTARTRGEP